ncbi:hypothetical protein TWF506_009949 [Arthrobotrys conoides]|uniref:F-box domain-containing protein n=1 Tax=Arthrobotrys conoides TaxID=74498 RepID=A0AAN8RWH8_9PEZI
MQNPESKPKSSPFGNLPPEIQTCIFEFTRPRDLRNLAKCSKWLYNGAFHYRFRAIILNSDPGSSVYQIFRPIPSFLLQDGLLSSVTRQRIRAIRFEPSRSWRDSASNVCTRSHGRMLRPDNVLTRIRKSLEALAHFPALQKLYISYEIPCVAENNVFLAIMNAITEYGYNFHERLKVLQFEVTKTFEGYTLGRYNDENADQIYEIMFSSLSISNRIFLGYKVPDEEIRGLVRARTPKFPHLRCAEFMVNGIPSPFTETETHVFKRSEFYFIAAQSTPLLEKLVFHTMARDGMTTDYKFFDNQHPKEQKPWWEITPEEQEKINNPPPRIHLMSDFTSLETIVLERDKLSELGNLVNNFPNLTILEIVISEICSCKYYISPDAYEAIVGLKRLTRATLPWPRMVDGPLHPDILGETAVRWKINGMRNLEVVTYRGVRLVVPHDLGHGNPSHSWDNVEANIALVPNEAEPYGIEQVGYGDVNPHEYMDAF